MTTDVLVRRWTADIIKAHPGVGAVAVRQRAKFEGWLKLELAAYADTQGATAVRVEVESEGGRSDLAFELGGISYAVELKTSNTNWRMEGIENSTRPITKNISSIVADVQKLQVWRGQGIVAFCMFPVPPGDNRWEQYLARVGSEVGVQLSALAHSERVSVAVSDKHSADIVVVAFFVDTSQGQRLPNQRMHPTAAGSAAEQPRVMRDRWADE